MPTTARLMFRNSLAPPATQPATPIALLITTGALRLIGQIVSFPGSFSATWVVSSTGFITQGLSVAQGVIPAGIGVQVGSFPTQTDIQSTWSDGSLRSALITFNATSTGTFPLTLVAL